MTTSPTPSQSDVTFETNVNPTITTGSDQPNLPLLFKYNEEYNDIIAHVDENNENDAVREIFF